MASERLSFKNWQTLACQEPERLVDQFFGKFELLSHNSQRAFVASTHDRRTLIQKVKASCHDLKMPLAGVPYVIQDMFDLRGLPTQCGAPFLEPFEAPLIESSLLAQEMARMGGACIAKTIPSEFGWDPSGQNANFGNCPHSDGFDYICGGGAGGSAYAVANGWAPIGFGLDSCGGIRIPSAFHGLFGFRMEHNAYARDGVFPIIPSLESVGWMTATLEDLRASFFAFYHPKSTELKTPPRGFTINFGLELATPETRAGLLDLIRNLNAEDDLPVDKRLSIVLQQTAQAFEIIENRELYSVHKYWAEEYRASYDERLMHKIDSGRAVNSTDLDYATQVQQNLRETLVGLLQEYDYLILPVSPLPTPENTEWDTDLEKDILQLNSPVSLASLPCLILPFKCENQKYNAAQILFNPKKMGLVTAILDQLRDYYARN